MKLSVGGRQINKEEYELKISELELQVEDHERTLTSVYGLVFFLFSESAWDNFFLSLAIGFFVAFYYWRYEAKKPFSGFLNKKS